MTPEQTKRRMAVMAKHDRDLQKLGWTIEVCESRTGQWIKLLYDPNWDREFGAYRAVRIERTPRSGRASRSSRWRTGF